MNSRRTYGPRGSAAPSQKKNRTVRSGDEWVYASSDESVYAGSSSSSSSGRGSSCGSSLSSSDGYLNATESCCVRHNDHYDEVGGYWEQHLAAERCCCLRARPNASAVVASHKCSQTPSGWTTSSLLCGVSGLLAACSISSLAACIAMTSFSLMHLVPSREAASADYATKPERDDLSKRLQIDSWTERPLLPPPWAGGESPSQQRATTQNEPIMRYSLDCNAQAGHTQCRPVQKRHSGRESTLFSDDTQHRQPLKTFRVLTDGVYYLSAQIAGMVWQPPPTLLRVVIARVTAKSRTVNVTTAHAISGVVGGGDLSAFTERRGAFSVYTAVALPVSVGDELQAQVVCVEEPNCVVHVNGTTSYLTLEKLN